MTSTNEAQSNEYMETIVDLIKTISQHKALNNYIIPYNGNNFINYKKDDDVNKDADFEQLIMRLDELTNACLITDKGQHSNMFYQIRRYDIYTKTAESDSCGPLSSLIGPSDKSWVYCYG